LKAVIDLPFIKYKHSDSGVLGIQVYKMLCT